MIQKMEKKYRKLNNELRKETDKVREKWLKEKCEEIEGLERKGKYEMMYKTAMELVHKGNKSASRLGIENTEGIIVTEPEQVLNR